MVIIAHIIAVVVENVELEGSEITVSFAEKLLIPCLTCKHINAL